MTSDMTARMLRLLSLLQTRREWSGADLAERLSVTVRTVRRDIDRLRNLGYPVDSARGHAGGYRLASGTDLPPLLLDDGEAVAITVALRTAAGGLTGIEETALRALAKLEQVLPRRLRGQVNALQTTASGIAWETRGPRADPALLAALAVACRDSEIVTFDYTARHGTTTARRAEPCHLVDSGGLWYLLAHDTDKDDWRLFRLDRMTDVAPTGRRVPPRPVPGGDPAAFAAGRLSAAPTRYRAIATVHAAADHVRARNRGLATRLRPLDERTWPRRLRRPPPPHRPDPRRPRHRLHPRRRPGGPQPPPHHSPPHSAGHCVIVYEVGSSAD
ncbi:putative DNA-binding transcriptional regulator YafY [Streptomyces griseochromogenes]|uniref:DNA-binding transcriptional regulator YafY n=1 Tax=Streptomyces griseochromogenes TaxID=68214 RepID=A0ABS4M7A4_9ACTN|nr:WYL domain-containing protein [Streptomyces griseochromogenes]MBP2055337.1 putative DNA-binding transcriptional regulator YafY [Streptomyces griseochromogenes]